MNPNKQKSLDSMRTFARDVDRERGTPAETKEPEKVTETVTENISVEPKKRTVFQTPKLKASKHEPKKIKKEAQKKKLQTKDTPEPKSIPAFHELQKVVTTNIKATEDKKKTKQTKKGITASKPVGGGTVITDTKKERRSFFSELSKSLTHWFDDLKKSLEPKKKNTYTVSQASRRKGVVQKATSKTGTIFSADNETLREQIKARQRAERKKDDGDDLSWSPFTEPGYPLLEDDETESSDPRITKISVVHKTHAKPKPVLEKQKPVPVIKSTEKIAELQEPKEVEVEPMPEPVVEEVVSELEKVEIVEPTEEAEVLDAEVPEEAVEEGVEGNEEIEWHLEDVSLRDTNTLAMLLVGLALGLGIIGFFVFSFVNLGNSEPETAATPLNTLYPDATANSITLTNGTYNHLLSQVNSELFANEQNKTVEYTFVDNRETTIAPKFVMDIIQTDTSDGFANTVSDIRLIETDRDKRAILFTSTDAATARGGMLNWETTILSDIGTLLTINNVPPSAGEFTDVQFGDLDVRALVFGDQTLMVYTVKNATVIIANDINVLTPLTENE